ncbi:MAG TPA: alanine racemase [Acidimicrobiales bacterium]|nr:alanine racemase [Acidimicrobiales bacterium]
MSAETDPFIEMGPMRRTASHRPVWAEIDLSAIGQNVRSLCRLVAPSKLCAVVKADAYGHGAVPVARAVLDAGGTWLAVAMVEEGASLRDAGIDSPILLLSEPPEDAMRDALELRLTPTLYTPEGIEAAANAARLWLSTQRLAGGVSVHVKVDTGMHRVGADLEDAASILGRVLSEPALALQGTWTHLAVADGVSDEERAYTEQQLERFEDVLSRMRAAGVSPGIVHAANSAGAIAHPGSRFDMVRCGIALYGEPPALEMAEIVDSVLGVHGLRPVMTLKARVSMVRELEAGERPSYGRRVALRERSVVATVPIGYADGVPRRYFTEGGTVLVGGTRHPLAGTVTMDQIVVDCGPGSKVAVGDEVIMIGRQGLEQVTAGDWAKVLGTISYEVLCGIGPRVPRIPRISGSVEERE